MVCSNCGNELKENATFCTNCGTKAEGTPVAPAPVEVTPVEATPVNVVSDAPKEKEPSRFTGKTIALIGINLLTSLVTTVTLGFAYPAMYCFKMRWIYRNTIINGHRMKFTGRGGQLFWRYILWTLLTVITLGIFGLWVPVKYKKWEISHVEIDEDAAK